MWREQNSGIHQTPPPPPPPACFIEHSQAMLAGDDNLIGFCSSF